MLSVNLFGDVFQNPDFLTSESSWTSAVPEHSALVLPNKTLWASPAMTEDTKPRTNMENSQEKDFIPADWYCRHQLLRPGRRNQQNGFWGRVSPVLLLARPVEVNSLKDVARNAVFVGRHGRGIGAGFPDFRGDAAGGIGGEAAHGIHGQGGAGQRRESARRAVFPRGHARRGLWRGAAGVPRRAGGQLAAVEPRARVPPFCTWRRRP